MRPDMTGVAGTVSYPACSSMHVCSVVARGLALQKVPPGRTGEFRREKASSERVGELAEANSETRLVLPSPETRKSISK